MRVASASLRHLRYIMVHKDKVAETPAHDKKMEDLMGSKILMLCIEQRKLQCVDHTADGVNHATSHQPYKSGGGKGLYQWNHSKLSGITQIGV